MENETKLCKHCKSEIPKAAKVCPNCRRKMKHQFIGLLSIPPEIEHLDRAN